VARSLGDDDPRTEQQRRADLFADLLLGRLAFDQPESDLDADDEEEPRTTLIRRLPSPSWSGWRWKTLTPTPANC
jgi:hypothetical protein